MSKNLKITIQSLLIVLVLTGGLMFYQNYQNNQTLTVPENYQVILKRETHSGSETIILKQGDTYLKSDNVMLWPIYFNITTDVNTHLKDASIVKTQIKTQIMLTDSFFSDMSVIYAYRNFSDLQTFQSLYRIRSERKINAYLKEKFIMTCQNYANYDVILKNRQGFDNDFKKNCSFHNIPQFKMGKIFKIQLIFSDKKRIR